MNEKELARVYETLLSVPGMNENVKVDLRLPRKSVLLLTQVIEKGMESHSSDADEKQELESVVTNCLAKAGLTELSQKLKNLTGS